MTAVIQRVKHASVEADGIPCGKCGKGLFILLGVMVGDTTSDADALASKIAKLRIFCDENDKLNLSMPDVGGSALVISNFTLAAEYKKGNRPDYLRAAPPAEANTLYEYFISKLAELSSCPVESGRFGAHMEIDARMDGPITIVMDSAVLTKKG